MERNSRAAAAIAGFGSTSLSLERATGTAACPGCGGASWLPLSTIAPSLCFVPSRLAVVPAVPAVARVRA